MPDKQNNMKKQNAADDTNQPASIQNKKSERTPDMELKEVPVTESKAADEDLTKTGPQAKNDPDVAQSNSAQSNSAQSSSAQSNSAQSGGAQTDKAQSDKAQPSKVQYQSVPLSNNAPKKRKSKIVSAIISVVIVLMMLGVGYLMISAARGSVPYIFGYAVVQIKTPSMEPVIPTGDYILVKSVDPKQIKVNDVIIFYSDNPEILGQANTHRVVDIKADAAGRLEFITKGDNNPKNDAQTAKESKVTGRFLRTLPSFTKIASFLQRPFAFLICILIPAFLLLFLCIRDLVKKTKDLSMETMVQQELNRMKQSGELERLKASGELDILISQQKQSKTATTKSKPDKKPASDTETDRGENHHV